MNLFFTLFLKRNKFSLKTKLRLVFCESKHELFLAPERIKRLFLKIRDLNL